MSFILDALKKSETDRQRQNGPALFEVKVAPPRNGLPLWAVGLGVLLAVNLVIVAWVLLRRPAQAETNAAQGAQQSFQASGGRDGPGSQPGGGGAWQGQGGQTWQGGQGQTGQGQAWQGGQQGQPGQGQGWQGAQQGQPGQGQGWQGAQQGQPGQGQGWQGGQQGPGQGGQGWQQPQTSYPGQGAPVAGTAPTGPLAQAAGPTGAQSFNGAAGAPDTGGVNPDDYAPAADPPAPAPFGNHVSQGTASGVPLYQQAALQPGTHIPELRLDLHVFDTQPQKRFVMINMHKLHEGDTLPEGVRVESIVPEGAVLSKDGTRFLLPRQ